MALHIETSSFESSTDIDVQIQEKAHTHTHTSIHQLAGSKGVTPGPRREIII